MSNQDPYQILELRPGASDDEIRAAYRRLAKKYHPDLSRDAATEGRFRAVQEAYETLTGSNRPIASEPTGQADPPKRSTERVRTASYGGRSVEDPSDAPKVREQAYATELGRLTEFLRQNKLAEAERLASGLIQREPRLAPAYAALGDIAIARGNRAKATEHFAYAMQLAPDRETYQEKYELCMRGVQTATRTTSSSGVQGARVVYQAAEASPAPLAVGIGAIMAASAYVVLSAHPPMLPKLSMISSWSAGFFIMLAVGGLALGVGLSMSRLVDNFALAHTSSVARITPTAILGMVAALNFWVAALLFAGLSLATRTMNQSTTRFMIGVGLVTLLFVGAAGAADGLKALEAFVWGGNIVYLGALGGWLGADSFERGN